MEGRNVLRPSIYLIYREYGRIARHVSREFTPEVSSYPAQIEW